MAEMNATVDNSVAGALSEREREALVSLLADEDPAVHHIVRERILSFGPAARAWLKPHLLSADPLMRRRTREIVHNLSREQAEIDFRQYCHRRKEEPDIEEGSWLLAHTLYPEFNIEAYRALLDSYAAELRGRTDPASYPEANLMAISQHLFQNLGYCGNGSNYHDPDNSCLNKVMDSRTGNPISLCVIYLLVARRLGIQVTGIGLPGHFLCRFQSSLCEVYIDCFNLGRFLTKANCIRYLVQQGRTLDEGHLSPLSARRMLLRMCMNLHGSFTRLKQEDELRKIQSYIDVLQK